MLWGFIQGSASGMKMSSGQMGRRLLGLTVAGMTLAAGGAAFGQQPKPWEITLQEAATPVMENITSFHNLLLVIITVITLFVLALLVIVVVKFNGKQWYWSYAYPDNGKFEFDSLMAADKQPRLLGVDNEMVVPVNKVVRVQTTGADVIHAFAVPSFGIKIDSIPGR